MGSFTRHGALRPCEKGLLHKRIRQVLNHDSYRIQQQIRNYRVTSVHKHASLCRIKSTYNRRSL